MKQVISNLWIMTVLLALAACSSGGSGTNSDSSGEDNPLSITSSGYINGDDTVLVSPEFSL